jgi:hypothetical protein
VRHTMADSSESVRWRILFLNNGQRRKFWWFKLNGEDLYFGPSSKTQGLTIASFDGTGSVLSVPEDIDDLPLQDVKLSYHASGQFHIKITDDNQNSRLDEGSKNTWRPKKDIAQLYRICAVISKPVQLYSKFRGDINRGNAKALVIEFDEKDMSRRQYFEFFISPRIFPMPSTLLASKTPLTCPPIAALSLSEKYILSVRQATIRPGSQFDELDPELEIFIVTNDAGNTNSLE